MRLLVELLPEPEAEGLLALMLLHESRRAGAHVAGRRAGAARRAGPLALEPRPDRRGLCAGGAGVVVAPVRSVHASGGDRRRARRGARCRRQPTGRRSSACTTCWSRADPSPVVELNRAAAVAMRDGPAAGLALIDAILARGDLDDYHLAHSARADLCRRLGRTADARAVLRTGPRADTAGTGAALSRAPIA